MEQKTQVATTKQEQAIVQFKGEPKIDEIRKGREIGRTSYLYVWHACIDCHKKRWVQAHDGKPNHLRCRICSNRFNHPRGGTTISRDGYRLVKLNPGDFFYPMTHLDGYVLEHRLVVAKALNRCLLAWEVVHHKGTKYPLGSKEDKTDNRYPENLQLLASSTYHLIPNELKAYIKRLETKIDGQTKQIKVLQWHITELEKFPKEVNR